MTRRFAHRLRCFLPVIVMGLLVTAEGCHSPFVQTIIDNQSDATLKLVEVDYPSASFGVETLAAHSKYHYRFKIQGSGTITLQFADASGKLQTSTGPELSEGQEGSLQIIIGRDRQVSWKPVLRTTK